MSKKPTTSAAKKGGRESWLDDNSGEPLIHEQAGRLKTFLTAMADGKVDRGELEAQEQRLVGLLKSVEPKLDDELHHEVTALLCELTAYNIMHTVHGIADAAPKTKFRG